MHPSFLTHTTDTVYSVLYTRRAVSLGAGGYLKLEAHGRVLRPPPSLILQRSKPTRVLQRLVPALIR